MWEPLPSLRPCLAPAVMGALPRLEDRPEEASGYRRGQDQVAPLAGWGVGMVPRDLRGGL